MFEEVSKFSRPWTSGSTHRASDGTPWFDLLVATPWGFVSAYSESTMASYRFIYKGQFYYASERRGRTKRGLSIVAGKLARRWVKAACAR